MSVLLFDNDESGYLDWVRSHPAGFVANVDRKGLVSNYPMVHLATHRTMSSEQIGNFTTGAYLKACADDLDELEKYCLRAYGRKATRCQSCL